MVHTATCYASSSLCLDVRYQVDKRYWIQNIVIFRTYVIYAICKKNRSHHDFYRLLSFTTTETGQQAMYFSYYKVVTKLNVRIKINPKERVIRQLDWNLRLSIYIRKFIIHSIEKHSFNTGFTIVFCHMFYHCMNLST